VLEVNISKLYTTARLELKRKDAEIVRLRRAYVKMFRYARYASLFLTMPSERLTCKSHLAVLSNPALFLASLQLHATAALTASFH
jgi:hypothetical protein